MTSLPEQIIALHEALRAASLPHAFGGALALAWCTRRARGTIDIDVNVFVPARLAAAVLKALPAGVSFDGDAQFRLERDGQIRLWWGTTPLDVFLDVTDFHEAAAGRIRWERFMERSIPFLACRDLAVFKAFFDRSRDWADLEEMRDAGCLDLEFVIGIIAGYLGADDHRVARLQAIGGEPSGR